MLYIYFKCSHFTIYKHSIYTAQLAGFIVLYKQNVQNGTTFKVKLSSIYAENCLKYIVPEARLVLSHCTDKKEKKIFLIHVYEEIQKGTVAKSYITNGPPHI
jgi:hypothetical protein